MVLVMNDTINITRITNIKKHSTSCTWLKIYTQESTIEMSAWYRQWEHPEEIRHLSTDGVDDEVSRKWSQAYKIMGINPNSLSFQSGTA